VGRPTGQVQRRGKLKGRRSQRGLHHLPSDETRGGGGTGVKRRRRREREGVGWAELHQEVLTALKGPCSTA
jgi:hypothetical protein